MVLLVGVQYVESVMVPYYDDNDDNDDDDDDEHKGCMEYYIDPIYKMLNKRVIGSGSFSQVFRALLKRKGPSGESSLTVAAKVLSGNNAKE